LLRKRWLRGIVVMSGIIVGQALLYGPSLVGSKVLLPVTLLKAGNYYLPRSQVAEPITRQEHFFSDLILFNEPMRHFAASEYAAGRVPMWCPNQYCGVPFATFPKYSLFEAVYYLLPAPYGLAWVQLFLGVVTGLGAYLLFRRTQGLHFWPSALAAWCYPLTGFLIVWQGYYSTYTVALFPWMLLAVDRAIRRPGGLWGPGLAVLTALLLTSGAIDMAAQVLLACGLFALWRLYLRHGRRKWRGVVAAAVLVLGWGLGMVLAVPYLLPIAEYVPTGARMQRRAQGAEERPPVGLAALPQVVLPYTYGDPRDGSYFGPTPQGHANPSEAAPSAYAGLLALCVLAPLGWCRRRLRSLSLLWLLLGLLGLAWVLEIPGLVHLLRLPGLNMMSFNRFTFVTGLSVLALAAIGLDVLARGAPPRRAWYLVAMLPLLSVGIWCLGSGSRVPQPLQVPLEKVAQLPKEELWRAEARQLDFQSYHLQGAAWCVAGLAAWLLLWRGLRPRPWVVPVFGGAVVAELLTFAWGFNPQCDPALYYPPLPPLQEVAQRQPQGRILGWHCLPPNVGELAGLRDVRGYDSVDPLRLSELLKTVEERSARNAQAPYAMTADYVPRLPHVLTDKFLSAWRKQGAQEADVVKFQVVTDREFPSSEAMRRGLKDALANKVPERLLNWLDRTALLPRMPGVLNMLNLRYLVGRGTAPPNVKTVIEGDDYWVWENDQALPRAFIPARVEPAPAKADLLQLLGSPSFDPRAIAYVEGDFPLPAGGRGSVELIEEPPTHLTLKVDMQTDGLVVLGDLWYEGWEAELDGRPLPVLRVNHAIRGVVVPAGEGTLQFRYRPKSFTRGLQLFGAALAVVALWAALAVVAPRFARRRARKVDRPR
jgi:hypothetical protein